MKRSSGPQPLELQEVIRYTTHSTIDRNKWDECILNSSTPLVYAQSWYLDLVAPGWDGLVLNEYEAVFPLPHRNKWGFHYCYQPPFVQQLGVFGVADATPFLAAIPSRFKLIDLQLNSGNTCDAGKTQMRPNLVLDLGHPIESLRNKYAENTIRNIRKANRAGLISDTTTEVQEIITLFRRNRGRSLPLTDTDYAILFKIAAEAGKRGLIEVNAMRNVEGVLHAGAIFLRSPHGWIFLFSAVHPDGRESGAMPALIDRFIERHAGDPCLLDFEGSSDPNLHRFYKSFGSRETVYLQVRINRLPFPFRLLKS